MVKFYDGSVTGAGNTKGTEYVKLRGNNGGVQSTSGGSVVSGGTDFPDETNPQFSPQPDVSEIITTELAKLDKNMETLQKFIKLRDFSDENYAEFEKVADSVNASMDALRAIKDQLSPEQKAQANKVFDAMLTYENLMIRDEISSDVADLDYDFDNLASVPSFIKNSLNPVRDKIIDQLDKRAMTESENVVYGFLDQAIAAGVEPDKIPGYDKLTNKQRQALDDAYENSRRDVLVERLGDKNYPKKINQDKKPSVKEMIYWVKNAFDDFGINGAERSDVDQMVHMAVSEFLYDGRANNTNVLVSDLNKLWMPSFSEVRQKIYDNPQAKLTPREQKVFENYKHAQVTDPDGGQQATYGGYLHGLADVIYGGGAFLDAHENAPKPPKTITRRRD